jgi:hypothetical protein
MGGQMKKVFASLVVVAALAAPAGWASVAGAKTGPDPDANGDVHSNCHTGSKFRGAGGEDNGPGNPKDTRDNNDCVAAPVTPSAPSAPTSPAAPTAGAAAVTAGAATPVVAAPRVTG